jgi:predicted nucleic acid-binding Zn finger protein
MAAITKETLEDEIFARLVRAQAELHDTLFVRFPDHIHVLAASGEEYRIVNGSCSCPDALYRAHPAGIRCKHEIGCQLAEARGELN